MMRKLIVQEWLSVDGYAADEHGSTDFFGPTLDHTDMDQYALSAMDSIDTILLGANTYRLFLDFWPTDAAKGEIMADRLNATSKIVFSNSLEKVEWGKWDAPKLQHGDAVAAVKKLKEQEGKDLIVWGSLKLTRSLLEANLVDEIKLGIVPVILGKGLRLFGALNQLKLSITEFKKFNSGITIVTYKV
ncbi:MAG: reductase, partial [Chitinophagaceae bacterium]